MADKGKEPSKAIKNKILCCYFYANGLIYAFYPPDTSVLRPLLMYSAICFGISFLSLFFNNICSSPLSNQDIAGFLERALRDD